MRALLVDDSRPIRRIESNILNELGFETTDAGNGKEALTVLETEPLPLVALVDWNMPEMDGLEFVKRVRDNERFSSMAIVMVTTETEVERVALALASGADEYLMKPFQKDQLTDKLRILGLIN